MAGNWSASSGGPPGASIPDAPDTVIIQAGETGKWLDSMPYTDTQCTLALSYVVELLKIYEKKLPAPLVYMTVPSNVYDMLEQALAKNMMVYATSEQYLENGMPYLLLRGVRVARDHGGNLKTPPPAPGS